MRALLPTVGLATALSAAACLASPLESSAGPAFSPFRSGFDYIPETGKSWSRRASLFELSSAAFTATATATFRVWRNANASWNESWHSDPARSELYGQPCDDAVPDTSPHEHPCLNYWLSDLTFFVSELVTSLEELQFYRGKLCLGALHDLADVAREMTADAKPSPDDPWWTRLIVSSAKAFANHDCYPIPKDIWPRDDSLLPPDIQRAWNSTNATVRETVRRSFFLVGWYLDEREDVQKYGERKGWTDPALTQFLPMLSPLLMEDAARSRNAAVKDDDENKHLDPLLRMERYDFLRLGAPRGSNTMLMGPANWMLIHAMSQRAIQAAASLSSSSSSSFHGIEERLVDQVVRTIVRQLTVLSCPMCRRF